MNHSVSMHWEAIPDTVMMLPVSFPVAKSDSDTETIEAVFTKIIGQVRVENERINILPQTTIQRSEICRAK